MNKNIEIAQAAQWNDEFRKEKTNAFIQNAVIHNDLKKVALNYEKEIAGRVIFPENFKTGDIISQKASSRCWLFASLNMLREKVISANNIKSDFAFSTGYVTFWDRMEKANKFLEEVIELGEDIFNVPFGMTHLTEPAPEGGQWFMFRNIVEKYGLVPMDSMPETFHSIGSADYSKLLKRMLRNGASQILELKRNGADDEALRAKKEEILGHVYKMFCCTLGTPPKTVTFEYYDKDDNYHRVEGLTPHEFLKKFWPGDVTEYITCTNAPGRNREMNKTYTVERFGNMVGGVKSFYYNIEMSEIKELIKKQLDDGEGVVFGCDSANMMNRTSGIMSVDTYEMESLFGMENHMSKADLMDTQETMARHAMVICAYKEFDDGRRYWKVENSWGTDFGQKGYWIMDEEYLDKYAIEFTLNKKYLNEKQLQEIQMEPTVLRFDDPLGA